MSKAYLLGHLNTRTFMMTGVMTASQPAGSITCYQADGVYVDLCDVGGSDYQEALLNLLKSLISTYDYHPHRWAVPFLVRYVLGGRTWDNWETELNRARNRPPDSELGLVYRLACLCRFLDSSASREESS